MTGYGFMKEEATTTIESALEGSVCDELADALANHGFHSNILKL
jgi:hypothetical protein